MVYELVTWLSLSVSLHGIGARSTYIPRIFHCGKMLYNWLRKYGCINKNIIKVSGG